LNEKDAHTLSDILIEIYVFIKAHYCYYAGVLVGMLDNSKKFDTWIDFIKYNIISAIMVNVSLVILIENKAPLWAVIIFCNLVGLYFHPTLKHFSVEALPKIFNLITDSVLKIGKAIADRIIDIINKK
jgi:hypothetical protein